MDKPGYTPGRGYEQGHVYRAMLSAAPQPTAGGDAADVPFKSTLKRIGHRNPDNAVLAETIIQAGDKWIGAGMIDGALSAERARVIEECAKVAEAPCADDDRMDRQIRNHIAAALRALGQQDTGGAGL